MRVKLPGDEDKPLVHLHRAQAIKEATQQTFVERRKSEKNLVVSPVTPNPCPFFFQLKVQFRTVRLTVTCVVVLCIMSKHEGNLHS